MNWEGGAEEGEEVLPSAQRRSPAGYATHANLAPPPGLPRLLHPGGATTFQQPAASERSAQVRSGPTQGWDGVGSWRPGERREGLGTVSHTGPQAGAETGGNWALSSGRERTQRQEAPQDLPMQGMNPLSGPQPDPQGLIAACQCSAPEAGDTPGVFKG